VDKVEVCIAVSADCDSAHPRHSIDDCCSDRSSGGKLGVDGKQFDDSISVIAV